MSTETARTKHLIATFKDKPRAASIKKMGDIQNLDKIPTQIRIAMLHTLLLKLDSDWPYTLTYQTSSIPATSITDVAIMPDVCAECGGLIYNNPSLTYNIIVDVASALDLEPAAFMLVDEGRCKEASKWLLEKSPQSLGEALPNLHLYEYSGFVTKTEEYVLDMLNINCLTPENIVTAEDIPNLNDQDWDLKFYSHGASTYEDAIEARVLQAERTEPFAHVHSGALNTQGV